MHIYFSNQLSIQFQLLHVIKTLKCCKIKTCHAFKLSEVVFIILINVKMPTIVGILTFISMINFITEIYYVFPELLVSIMKKKWVIKN